MKTVEQYIDKNHGGNKAAFSRSVTNSNGRQGVSPTVTHGWLKKGFIVTAEGWLVNPANTCRVACD